MPDPRSVTSLLPLIRDRGASMAVVVNESGAAEGILTLEDILEEVVGEIADEHDADEGSEHWIRKIEEQDFLFNGRVDMQTVEEELGLALCDEDEQTLAGFLSEVAEGIPASGAVIEHRGVTFTVNRTSAQGIDEVRVTW